MIPHPEEHNRPIKIQMGRHTRGRLRGATETQCYVRTRGTIIIFAASRDLSIYTDRLVVYIRMYSCRPYASYINIVERYV